MGVTQGAGLSLRWFRDEVAGSLETEAARKSGDDIYAVLTRQAEEALTGSDGLFFLPYLMGERTPHLNPKARGVWFGLTASHRRAHLVRSVLEGVSYSLKDCLDIIAEMGLPVEQIRASGSGAKSTLWRQIQADMFEREVLTINATEGPSYGAALLAGVGIGFWRDVPTACESTIRLNSRLEPQPSGSEVYRRGHSLYRELYERLKPLYERL
jgi:xylulokinase